jgi:hypothetical protein
MTRSEAKKLAETVTINELKFMFVNAYGRVKNWEVPSKVNKSISLGASFNIYTNCGLDENTHILAKTNMIRDFGEYLPNYEKKKRLITPLPKIHHEQPNLLGESFYDYDVSTVLR